jgi:hypothetical protein
MKALVSTQRQLYKIFTMAARIGQIPLCLTGQSPEQDCCAVVDVAPFQAAAR